jgi:hypothetical protein
LRVWASSIHFFRAALRSAFIIFDVRRSTPPHGQIRCCQVRQPLGRAEQQRTGRIVASREIAGVFRELGSVHFLPLTATGNISPYCLLTPIADRLSALFGKKGLSRLSRAICRLAGNALD